MFALSGELAARASVLIPVMPGHYKISVQGLRPVDLESDVHLVPGLKTAAAAEIHVEIEIFFGSLRANGLGSDGFSALEDD